MILALIFALGIVAYILLDLTFRLDDEHIFLKILTLFFVFFILVLIPKATLDPTCDLLLNSSSIVGNLTTYTYDTICLTAETKTPNIFFESTMAYIKLLFLYLFLYMMYRLMFKKVLQNKGWIKSA